MENFWLAVVLTLNCVHLHISHTFILPLKTSNGSLDVEHLVGHVSLLEQTIAGVQQTIRNQDIHIAALTNEISNLKSGQQTILTHNADITTLKMELSNLKANQQMTVSHHADIATLKSDVSSLKSNQQKLDKRIFDLQKQGQPNHKMADITTLKAVINATKTSLTLLSSRVTSLTSELHNLTQGHLSLSRRVYSMNPDGSITKTVHDIQATLGRVLSHVHSAENDRFFLHSSVNSLNKTIAALNNNSNVATTELSAQIAHLKTEVRFNICLGFSEIKLDATVYSTLKFKNIQYNIGGGYDANSGVFTVPVSGTYMFWAQVEKITGQYHQLFLKNGVNIIGYSYMSATGENTGTIITVAATKAGDQVYVMIHGVERVYCCVNTRFGGTLLNKH